MKDKALNIKCPECGNDAEVMISATSWFRVTPDGSAVNEGAVDWGQENIAYCPSCRHSGEVKDFIKEEAE